MTDSCVIIDADNQLPPLQPSPSEIKQMLLIIENEILSKTMGGVDAGNKVFGAAVLGKDFSLDYAETNAETGHPAVECLSHEVNLSGDGGMGE